MLRAFLVHPSHPAEIAAVQAVASGAAKPARKDNRKRNSLVRVVGLVNWFWRGIVQRRKIRLYTAAPRPTPTFYMARIRMHVDLEHLSSYTGCDIHVRTLKNFEPNPG